MHHHLACSACNDETEGVRSVEKSEDKMQWQSGIEQAPQGSTTASGVTADPFEPFSSKALRTAAHESNSDESGSAEGEVPTPVNLTRLVPGKRGQLPAPGLNVNNVDASSGGSLSTNTQAPLPPDTLVTRGLTGLSNLGNTCYMNSALQCLMHTLPLVQPILEGRHILDINEDNPLGTSGKLIRAFEDLLREYWTAEPFTSVSPHHMKRVVASFCPQFLGAKQQDAQELVSYVLDGLHEDLNRIVKRPYVENYESKTNEPDAQIAAECWRRHCLRHDSLIMDLFMGLGRSQLDCNVCSRRSIMFDPFLFLSLPIPPVPKTYDILVTVSPSPTRPDLRSVMLKMTVTDEITIADFRCRVSTVLRRLHRGLDEDGDPLPPMEHGETVSRSPVRLAEWTLTELYGPPPSETEATPYPLLFCRRVHGTRWEPCTLVHLSDTLVITPPSDDHLNRSDTDNHTKIHAFCFPSLAALSRAADISFAARMQLRGQSVDPSLVIGLDDNIIFVLQLAEKSQSTFSPKTSPLLLSFPAQTKVSRFMDELDKIKRARKEYISTTFPSLSEDSQARASDAPSAGSSICVYQKSAKGRVYNKVPLRVLDDDAMGGSQRSSPMACDTSVTMESSAATAGCDANGDEVLASEHSNSAIRISKPEDNTRDTTTSLFELVADLEHRGSASGCLIPIVDAEKDWFTQPLCLQMARDFDGTNRTSPISIEECLNTYLAAEVLDKDNLWYCSVCKAHRPATKQLGIWRLPVILTIHLKRFKQTDRLTRSKNVQEVLFPVEKSLDLRKYLCNSEPTKDEPPAMYRLYGIVDHWGSLYGGHYTASVRCQLTRTAMEKIERRGRGVSTSRSEVETEEVLRDRNGVGSELGDQNGLRNVWFKFNDSLVSYCPPSIQKDGEATEVPPNDPCNVGSEAAYLLFYVREDCFLDQEFTSLRGGEDSEASFLPCEP